MQTENEEETEDQTEEGDGQGKKEQKDESVKDDRSGWSNTFDLVTETFDVTLRRESGEAWECELVEMSGFERDEYLNQEKGKINPMTKQVKDFRDVEAGLIAKTLRDKDTQKFVTLKDIRHFPAKTQHRLYKMCLEINGFEDEADKKAKND